jgi:stage V sporulation protein B
VVLEIIASFQSTPQSVTVITTLGTIVLRASDTHDSDSLTDAKASGTFTAVSEKAVGAGRGLLFIVGAKLWFMVAGYVVAFALPRILNDTAKYGVWIFVLSAVSPVNNVVNTATIQGISKFVTEADGRYGSVLRAALRLQVFLGLGLAGAFFLGAPLIAGFAHDPGTVGALRVAAGIVLFYSFYATFVGAANGARLFHKQAALDMTASTLRAAAIVAGGLLVHQAIGSFAGWAVAAATIMLVSIFVVGFGESSGPFDARKLVRFFGGVVGYLTVAQLLIFVDSLLLKPLVAQAEIAAGAAPEAATALASHIEGVYGAAQTVARIPYQLILAVTFVIFPLVSRATFEADHERTRTYVHAAMRYSLLVVALLGVTLGARPEATLRFFYQSDYATGWRALAFLVGGYVAFALSQIACTVLNGAGRVRIPLFIGAVTLAAAAVANWLGVSAALRAHDDPMLIAAAATAGAMVLGLVMSLVALWRVFGASLPVISIVRIGAASAAAILVGHFWPATLLPGKVGTLASMSAVGLVFLVVVIGLGELRVSEVKKLRRETRSVP